jgi:ferredoxin-thioredoxin reductase catalytic subunit
MTMADVIRLELRKGSYQMPGDTLPYETQAANVANKVSEWLEQLAAGRAQDDLWNDACPCSHTWDEHNFDVGCIAGWEYEGPDPGIASKEGCWCQLAHTEKSI